MFTILNISTLRSGKMLQFDKLFWNWLPDVFTLGKSVPLITESVVQQGLELYMLFHRDTEFNF